MAIKVGQAFERTSAQPIDTTLTLTKTEMLNVNDNLMPSYYFTICQDDGKIYLYDKTAAASVVTGKFKKFEGGSGGSGAEIYHTTATLSETINDTTVVLAADLPGVTWTDLEVGKSIIRDDNGTWGIVTSINGTTDVTVTSATTSTPTVELTQAQYDALVAAGTVDDRTIYFVTDAQPVNQICYVGSKFNRSDIYDTDEKIIGSYMGKPLYQKTLTGTVPATTTDGVGVFGDTDITDLHLDKLVYLKGTTESEDHEWLGILNAFDPTMVGGVIAFVDTTSLYAPYPSLRVENSLVRYSDRPWVITLQYTKTTDPAGTAIYANENDYSTSEHIVGTWIDGKPIYQRVIDNVTITGTNPTVVYTFPSGEYLDKVIYAMFTRYTYQGAVNNVGMMPTYANSNGTNVSQIAVTVSGQSGTSVGAAIVQYTKTTD